MYKYGSNRSAIRDLFEYGKQRKQEIGTLNVLLICLTSMNDILSTPSYKESTIYHSFLLPSFFYITQKTTFLNVVI